jgi:hypothetical protein
MEDIKHPLTNAQLEILKIFSHDLNNDDLENLKSLLVRFFADKAISNANRTWDDNKWSNNDVDRMLETKMRSAKI